MPNINLIQKRIANLSIGSSTLRGQGRNAGRIAISYLKNMDLGEFSNINNELELMNKLNTHTKSLKKQLPNRSWGAARKAVNIFLFQVVHDIYLSEAYNLKDIIAFLEVPLDNPNAIRLVKEARNRNLKLHWRNIKNLNKEDSDRLQEFAKQYAKDKYSCERCYLDLYFWRE
ncbi:hypothetical protein MYX64_04030 [Nitrospinae bacterium AH_259_B05_G02_I21]|nr:hypothetical protein [Nitrospinae bacterium AH_259_B05_G02_I21]